MRDAPSLKFSNYWTLGTQYKCMSSSEGLCLYGCSRCPPQPRQLLITSPENHSTRTFTLHCTSLKTSTKVCQTSEKNEGNKYETALRNHPKSHRVVFGVVVASNTALVASIYTSMVSKYTIKNQTRLDMCEYICPHQPFIYYNVWDGYVGKFRYVYTWKIKGKFLCLIYFFPYITLT